MILVLLIAAALGKFGTDALTRDAAPSDPNAVITGSNPEAPTTTERNGVDAMAMCKGPEKTIPEAKPWKPGEPGIVADFTFDSFKFPDVWSAADNFLALAPLRTGISPGLDLDEVSLVLCRGRGSLQSKITCDYIINNASKPVEIRFWKRDLRLFEARTGRLVGQAELSHGSTACSNLIVLGPGDEEAGSDKYPDQTGERASLEAWTSPQ